LQIRGKQLCYRKVYSAARGKTKGSRRSFVKRTRPQQPLEEPQKHGAVTVAIMITEDETSQKTSHFPHFFHKVRMNTELVVAPEEAKKKGADKQEETQKQGKRENKPRHCE